MGCPTFEKDYCRISYQTKGIKEKESHKDRVSFGDGGSAG
jgi:hypothetical protein